MPKNVTADNRPKRQRDLRHASNGRRDITSIGESLARLALLRQKDSQAVEKQGLLDWLRAQLPAELAAHVQSVEVKAARALVIADSAAWSGRLRYAVAAISPQLAARTPAITGFDVKLRPRRPVRSAG